MNEPLILTPLRKAIASLCAALAQPKDEFVRDAVIQRFEYTYELAWKSLQRRLTEDLGSEAVAPLSRRDLFRLAAERALIDDPLPWFEYHKARNITSRTYNERIAEEVYVVAQAFLGDVESLLRVLEDSDA
jgi:nucleotidyltransferase substrate binding protein (TIGR01987 family)